MRSRYAKCSIEVIKFLVGHYFNLPVEAFVETV